jgi:hypothetical protein
MRRILLPAAVLTLVIVGGNRFLPDGLPGGLSRVSALFAPETQDQELARLETECEQLRRGIVRDTKVLSRVQSNYVLARRRKLRGPAMERIRLPMYQLRERIEQAKEGLAEKESRVAYLKDDQRRLVEPPEEPAEEAEGGFR